jgi:FKBP-type peptidyl-prolyl cis-trans isomerase SlyD
MKASRGTVVTMGYKLTDDEGSILDQSDKPFGYLHGYGNIIPGLESALEGAEPGHQQVVVVEPADAYGEVDPRAVFEVPAENLPEGVEFQPDMEVIADTPTGSVPLKVLEVKDDGILVDANHPLAGKRLHFDVEVVDVREALEEEIAQGCAL